MSTTPPAEPVQVPTIYDYVKKIPKKGSVRKSPYCTQLISMRLRGATYPELTKFLKSKGEKFLITEHTIWKSLRFIDSDGVVPIATLFIEQWGGDRELDLSVESDNLIHVQKIRVNNLLLQESKLQAEEGRENYTNSSIKDEMLALANMIKLRKIMTSEDAPTIEPDTKPPITTSQVARDALADLILNDEIVINQEWLNQGELVN